MATIQKTHDYDQFDFIEGNRDPQKVEFLINSIKKRNKLEFHPIHTVPMENGKLGIIDGQHRLMAAKSLGIPIYYTVDVNAKAEDIPLLNSNMRPWISKNYTKFYASTKDHPDYQFIEEMAKKYKFQTYFLISVCGSAKVNTIGKQKTTLIKEYRDGNLTLKFQKCLLEKWLKHVHDILELGKSLGVDDQNTTVYRALFNLVRKKGYSHKQMLDAVKKYITNYSLLFLYKSLQKVDDMLIEKVYNYKRHDEKNKLQKSFGMREEEVA